MGDVLLLELNVFIAHYLTPDAGQISGSRPDKGTQNDPSPHAAFSTDPAAMANMDRSFIYDDDSLLALSLGGLVRTAAFWVAFHLATPL